MEYTAVPLSTGFKYFLLSFTLAMRMLKTKLLFVADWLGFSEANGRSFGAEASVQLNTTALDVLKRVSKVELPWLSQGNSKSKTPLYLRVARPSHKNGVWFAFSRRMKLTSQNNKIYEIWVLCMFCGMAQCLWTRIIWANFTKISFEWKTVLVLTIHLNTIFVAESYTAQFYRIETVGIWWRTLKF